MLMNIFSCHILNANNMNLCFVANLVCLFSTISSEQDMINTLSDCSDDNVLQFPRGIILVSTLDGQITALHAEGGHKVSWNINTGPGPLLSSSIHKLELTSNGQWMRMIPSLSGGLYKFNGVNIESLPVRADHLLQSSSFLINDGLIISGGRENRIYGIDLDSGEIVYECSMNGCDYNEVSKNMIVIQRNTQTVRAIDMYTGIERWNFSVGYHDVKWPNSVGCLDKSIDIRPDFRINAIIPEGIVFASSKTQENEILWKQKFDSPVAAVWKLQNGKVHPVNLFQDNVRTQVWSTASDKVYPVLYIGMHNKQLYIQETVQVDNRLAKSSQHLSEMDKFRIPWDPVPASSTALGFAAIPDNELEEDDDATTALSVLYASEYINGNGYFLFSRKKSSRENNKCIAGEEGNITGISSRIDDFPDSGATDTPVNVIIVSLWYWWKEVLIISITTAILVNLVLTQRVLQVLRICPWNTVQKEIVFIEKAVSVELDESGSHSQQEENNDIEYKSRFLLDFETVRCLGKGGFGVVFEARNKIDECNYAVKRIQLPNSLESRERVLREVKALAKLDHHHIVRYFNSWMECPPPKWLETHDLLFCKQDSSIGEMVSSKINVLSTDNTKCSMPQPRKFRTSAIDPSVSFRQFSTFSNSFCENNDSFIVFHESQNNENDLNSYSDNENVFVHIEDSVSEKMSDVNSQCRNTSSLYLSRDDNSSDDFNAQKSLQSNRKMYLYIQMQLCHQESLKDWLSQNVCDRDKRKTLQMFEQILQAVEYIHLAGLIHRDLKPSNIFFSISGQIKVGDFGLVTAMANDAERTNLENSFNSVDCERHTAQVGTQLYMSPEQLTGMSYDYKVDIYSLGLIFFELLYPFTTQMERCETLQALRRNEFPATFKQRFTDEFDVLSLMLSHNPEKRPTTFGIRARLPLIKNVNFNKPGVNCIAWHFELPSKS